MIHQLDRTRPWVRLIGVLMIIGCVFIVLAGIFMMVMGGMPGMGEGMDSFTGMGLGVIYLLMAILYYFPAVYLLRYGSAIKHMQGRANTRLIEEALRHQASFWRFVGILAAAMLVIYALILGVAVVVGVIGTVAG
jgi:hypothetical protein